MFTYLQILCNKCLTPIVLSQYQSRYDLLYSQVCINPNTILFVYVSIYQSGYNSLKLYTLYTRTNTLVCINPDTTISVFLSMYQSRYILLTNSLLSSRQLILWSVLIQTQLSLYSWVCINPDTTRSETHVFIVCTVMKQQFIFNWSIFWVLWVC